MKYIESSVEKTHLLMLGCKVLNIHVNVKLTKIIFFKTDGFFSLHNYSSVFRGS